jgi:hypothetical protein
MSTGIFLSIEESYVAEARESARSLLRAVNTVLEEAGQPAVVDSEKGPHVCEGRTGLDHMGAATLAQLGEIAGEERPHVNLLAINPYRLVYVPRPLEAPQVTPHRETLMGQEVNILLGSSIALRDELLKMATDLGIPLVAGSLADDTAQKIDDMEPLREGEDDWDLIENTRMAWLIMHEAAALSVAKDVVVSLAG